MIAGSVLVALLVVFGALVVWRLHQMEASVARMQEQCDVYAEDIVTLQRVISRLSQVLEVSRTYEERFQHRMGRSWHRHKHSRSCESL